MMARVDLGRAFGLRAAGVYYALGLLIAALAVVTAVTGRPSYLSAVNLTNIVYQSAGIAIMGVAMTVVLITGNFDLSVASVAALAAAVQISVVDSAGFVPALLAALAVAGAVGLLNGVMVQFVGINAFIVSLGTLTAVRGLGITTHGVNPPAEDREGEDEPHDESKSRHVDDRIRNRAEVTAFEAGHGGKRPGILDHQRAAVGHDEHEATHGRQRPQRDDEGIDAHELHHHSV
jgi:hypothetical protein